MEAQFKFGEPLMVDYTPAGAVANGEVVLIGDHAYVAHGPMAVGDKKALAAGGGVYDVTAGEAIAESKKVWWNNGTNKVVETNTGVFFGITVPGSSAAADGDTVRVWHCPDFGHVTPAAAVVPLTDSTGGTPAASLVDGTGTYDQAKFNNNFASVATQLSDIIAALQGAGLMEP